ncbi:Non-ribosomal peptide synthetase [Aspergillus mulundensis]|uniref:Non-ribosomal peptide synthetase n=1 Tax=Aspergillus mulundensis TaxID=1810919 RepID=A0A0G3F1A3_9EURO|nr:Non-ribosomal peptide synthetase [Aspergillus mulundensis]AKJ70932.1 non-ribosomal peptide synthetase [Aspergillus mulundensis]RDW57870.1 Non-ribosomal peptide synthetase [Aspergillus mulundensis]
MPGVVDSEPWLQLELKRICANVLQLDIKDVDPKRSFLSLGGDSLLAIKILAQCRAQGITINIADIMAATTLESLYGMAQGPPELASSSSDKDSSIEGSGTLTPTSESGSTVAEMISPDIEAKLPSSPIQAIVPCSAIQDRILVSQLQNPHLYSCCFVLRFTHSHSGLPVDARRLGQAWGEVVKRHSSLRTALVESTQRPGHYNQVILSEIAPSIDYYKGSEHLSSAEFNVNNPIVFQPHSIPHHMQLVQVSPSEVYLKLDISHVLVDGQSAEVLLKDLSDAYRNGGLGPAPLSYADYVSSYLNDPSQVVQTESTSEITPLTVPMDRPNEGLSDFQTVSAKIPLDSQLVQAVCSKYSVTLATVCQLAWGLVLRCYGGADNVCFSYVNSGRSMSVPGVHDVIGPIVQTSMCAITLPAAGELSTILREIHKDAVKAMSQLSPLESNTTSKSARQLSNTTMSFQRALDDSAVQRAGLAVRIEGKANPTDYDISLGIAAGRDGLSIDLDFWSSRLDEDSARTILGAFEAAIRGIISTPDTTVSDISLLSSSDVGQLAQWNSTIPKPQRVCVHDKIIEIAKLQPDAVAVNSWDGDLTYHELTAQALTLAHHLRNEFGVGPEKFVGICMDKSKWAIVSMLAILMAGGIVVPLGVTHPRARVRGLLTDTAAVALLVDAKHADRLADLDLENTSTLLVDERLLSSLPSIPEPPVSGVTPDNAAWVIYTSGSTGVPKGVVLLHQNISTSVLAHGGMFGVNCTTRTAQFAAYTFDVSLSDIVMTLFHGGCVCVFSEESRMNNLTEALQALAVNYVNLTPTVLGLLSPADLPNIRTVVAGGEAMDPGIVAKWSPHAQVFNSVGPSETTIIAVAAGPVTDPTQAANVGYPTSTRLWVTLPTDPNQLCPVGVPGELLIEGPMLSRGYLNDPEKTAGAFITNPAFIKHLEAADPAWRVQFQNAERRMYRSGDLVRQKKDGSLVHMGRRDTQVKIRGQRVEIGEIEYWVMQRLKDVRRVAVIVVERGQGREQKALVAAVEFNEDTEFFNANTASANRSDDMPHLLPLTEPLSAALHQLRNDLMDHLPPYMSPSMYAPVSQLPLNLSGKIDRRAVTQFINDQDDAQLQQCLAVRGSHKEPSTETEHKLQTLWAKTLGVDISQVSADSHFFHIGGDSVAAMRVVAAARDVELVLRVADLFSYPRLDDLARAVESRVLDEDTDEDPAPFSVWRESRGIASSEEEDKLAQIAELCSLPIDQVEDVLPCTALQEGLIALTAQQPSAYVDRQVFALSDEVDVPRFRGAWQTVVNRTATLRTRIVSGPETGSLQVVVAPGEVSWSESSSLEDYLEADKAKGIVIGQPLNRFALVTQPDGQRFFVWTAHHSTYDGWSRGVVLQQVADVYLGKELAPVASFSRFIRYTQSLPQDAAASYWRTQLGGETRADFPALPSANYRPRPQQRHQHAITLARGTGSSNAMLPDLLRGAWALVVHQYIGKIDPVFAVALSGRNAPVRNVTSIAGPTFTTVPVRIFINPEQSVTEFLQSVRQQAIEMIPHEHTGLQRIRKLAPELANALDLRHLFVVQPANEDERMFKIPGVEGHLVAVDEFDSYGLNVECTLSGESVEVDVRFDEKMLSSVQIKRLVSQFESVAQQLHAQGSIKIRDIDFLGAEDVEQIQRWNAEPLTQPIEVCLHELLADVGRARPDAVAVEAWDGSLTHAQMQEYASALASHLVSLGVGPEVCVPVCLDKSVWAVVCFLGVLKAGGVVVPLGVGHPVGRIAGIVEDTKAKVILVDALQALRLSDLTSQGLTLLTVDAHLLNALPPATHHTAVTPSNAAWIVFTSGSTGKPKGVVLTHTNLSTVVVTHGARFGLGPHTRTIQFAAHTFDALLQDYFTTLVNGGTVCVPSEGDKMSNLAGVMRSMNINFANLTSTVARLLTPQLVPSLKLIVLAGEQIQDTVVETWYKHAAVLNSYGPSECSINSTCNGPITDISDAQSVGHGMGARLWIADPTNHHRLSPVGIPGEILIQGPGMARGYLNDAAKTESAFIRNPGFAARFGLAGSDCRVYATGDLGLQTEDGKVTYLGRIDTQIKIRGQRVEVGEIEHWIGHSLGQGHVKHAAVVPVSRGDKQLRLAAVIEFHGETREPDTPTFANLKKTLSSQLPPYMVPGLYIPVSQVPLTISGKLDRRVLKQMVESMSDAELDGYTAGSIRRYIPPSTPMEKALQRLWANALGMQPDAVGADDDFFQLGGDSVVAMHVAAAGRADQSIGGLGLAVGEIFMYPRLSDLAAFLEGRDDGGMEGEGEGEGAGVGDDSESPFALLQEALDLDLELEELV